MASMSSVSTHHEEVSHEKNDDENKKRVVPIKADNWQKEQ
tara:strand:- start:1051 stop:1170 length:120 start_codon:yes stop_codon:yes gene_type:complete